MNPRGPTPALYDSDLREEPVPASTLVEDLGGIVDDIRQIAVDFGARPLIYYSVTVRWSGGEVGRGESTIIRDTPILPTPRTEPVGYTDRMLESGGIVERGDITLSGISPRFTEDEIDQLFGVVAIAGEETFIEQRTDSRDGQTRRRRFVLAKAPERRDTRCDWKAVLRQADGARRLDGTARVPRNMTWRSGSP